MVRFDPLVAEDFGQFLQKTFDVRKGYIDLGLKGGAVYALDQINIQ